MSENAKAGDVLMLWVETNYGAVTAVTSSGGEAWTMVDSFPPKWWKFWRRLRKLRVELWTATKQ